MERLFAFAAVAVFLISYSGCAVSSLCENDVARELKSPDGQFKAVVFFRGCGATTAETANVSVLPAGDALPEEDGNICHTDEANIYVKWLSSSQLEVSATKGAKYYHRKIKVGSITVTYK